MENKERFDDLKYEDFCPISNTEALIVCGPKYNSLNEIAKVTYTIKFNKVVILSKTTVNTTDGYVRLGNIEDKGLLWCSIGDDIWMGESKFATGIQPYYFAGGLLFSKDNKIWLNQLFVDDKIIVEPWGEYVQVGRPTYYKGSVYFEARKTDDKHAAEAWEVWRMTLRTGEKEFLCRGANPYLFHDMLFYSDYDRLNHHFSTYCVPLNFIEDVRNKGFPKES